jgi:putative inorganic carbon (HCO3(-)) transporter
MGGYAHNCYLQTMAETGIIGLASFLYILYCFYRNFFQNFRRIKDEWLSLIALGFAAGISGFLVHIFIDTHLYSLQLGTMFWLALGIAIAAQQAQESGAREPVSPKKHLTK